MVKGGNPKDKCPRCGQGTLVTDANTGEHFCGKCGFVITDKVEEWDWEIECVTRITSV